MTRNQGRLRLLSGDLQLPAFLPDATRGVVRSLDSADLRECGIQALVMNTFHLMQHPGSSTVRALGGLHEMCDWPLPIFTDSGGFQAYSLIHENPKQGRITGNGLIIHQQSTNRKLLLTPEKSVQLQISFGSDVLFCLDDCTHVDAPYHEQEESVQRTVEWARRCKQEFLRLMEERRTPKDRRPMLFAVIQGGGARDLRERCAQELLEIGFDGYGFGGWPLDSRGELLEEMLSYTRQLIPDQFPMHALGVGHPRSIARCASFGYDLFDSALPTRDARHGRLYAFTAAEPSISPGVSGDWLAFKHISDLKYVKSAEPISAACDCRCCRSVSLGYLRHLFKIGDTLYMRLATAHNLRFMSQLMSCLSSPRGGADQTDA